ncbi:DNA-directed RNA polymerase II subunit RPB1-like isoform X27 [Pectinophora gossypiella]|uniref:DNA-directed RNA polymerase II subunit RPB1-like isoform X27 n=1 Tax=Pectinophora gossypiella TaxID=13191 RepID=UPI00214DFE9C|nr:DNA-directed RNA polymerase II subunit RPB1-like isoform X27 [Pectinophora gossypiella]
MTSPNVVWRIYLSFLVIFILNEKSDCKSVTNGHVQTEDVKHRIGSKPDPLSPDEPSIDPQKAYENLVHLLNYEPVTFDETQLKSSTEKNRDEENLKTKEESPVVPNLSRVIRQTSGNSHLYPTLPSYPNYPGYNPSYHPSYPGSSHNSQPPYNPNQGSINNNYPSYNPTNTPYIPSSNSSYPHYPTYDPSQRPPTYNPPHNNTYNPNVINPWSNSNHSNYPSYNPSQRPPTYPSQNNSRPGYPSYHPSQRPPTYPSQNNSRPGYPSYNPSQNQPYGSNGQTNSPYGGYGQKNDPNGSHNSFNPLDQTLFNGQSNDDRPPLAPFSPNSPYASPNSNPNKSPHLDPKDFSYPY